MVANGEESAVFVAFDTAITKLTYARATEVSNPIVSDIDILRASTKF